MRSGGGNGRGEDHGRASMPFESLRSPLLLPSLLLRRLRSGLLLPEPRTLPFYALRAAALPRKTFENAREKATTGAKTKDASSSRSLSGPLSRPPFLHLSARSSGIQGKTSTRAAPVERERGAARRRGCRCCVANASAFSRSVATLRAARYSLARAQSRGSRPRCAPASRRLACCSPPAR